jgi:signal transduction histidine kinase
MDGSKKIDLILLLGTGGMLLLAIFIILFVIAYQRRLLEKQREINEMELGVQRKMMDAVILTKEKEQKRMAQELHDGIGSALTALKMSLISMNLEADDKQRINNNLKSISIDVRRLSNELMPSILEDMGLQTAIEKLTNNLSESLDTQFTYDRDTWLKNLQDEQSQLAIYRVIQELLNNIVKYAKASTVNVREYRDNNLYLIEITDDGIGYSPSEDDFLKSGSLGLKNIQSRIQQVKGTINYQEAPKKGTVVKIEIPIDEKD